MKTTFEYDLVRRLHYREGLRGRSPVNELTPILSDCIEEYNESCLHSALDYRTPNQAEESYNLTLGTLSQTADHPSSNTGGPNPVKRDEKPNNIYPERSTRFTIFRLTSYARKAMVLVSKQRWSVLD